MKKRKLIEDLKEILQQKPDEISRFGINYYFLSESEIKGIIELLDDH